VVILIGGPCCCAVALLEPGIPERARRLAARVLVVEDDPVFRRFVLAALQETRFVATEADTASSLAEATHALATVSYDCVLLDLGLPDSQGIATVRSALHRAPDVPIVVLTGEEDDAIADRALREGAQDFLEKTQLEPSSLGRAIRHAVDRGRWAVEMAKNNAELERRNRDLDDFAHAVSHDLKAPLRAVYNLVDDAQEQLAAGDTAGVQQTLASMVPRLRRLFDMIDGVLRLTQVGRAALAVSVDVGALVREILDSLSLPAGFEVTVAPGMPTILAERAALGQVFQNLVDNAVKHHPGPTGRVEVAWRDLGTALEFSVADDGMGIPPEQRKRVFELFHTLGEHREGSTGIGLALVRKVVEANGGTVHAEDNPPRGARFVFTWPKLLV